MLAYLAFTMALIIAVYTILFAVENFRDKNLFGFWAILLLALACIGLPYYMLFLFN